MASAFLLVPQYVPVRVRYMQATDSEVREWHRMSEHIVHIIILHNAQLGCHVVPSPFDFT